MLWAFDGRQNEFHLPHKRTVERAVEVWLRVHGGKHFAEQVLVHLVVDFEVLVLGLTPQVTLRALAGRVAEVKRQRRVAALLLDVLSNALQLRLHFLIARQFLVEFVRKCVLLQNLRRKLLDQNQTQHREVEVRVVRQLCQNLCELVLLLREEIACAREEQQLVDQSLAKTVLDL